VVHGSHDFLFVHSCLDRIRHMLNQMHLTQCLECIGLVGLFVTCQVYNGELPYVFNDSF
jgi:hypothetical protein